LANDTPTVLLYLLLWGALLLGILAGGNLLVELARKLPGDSRMKQWMPTQPMNFRMWLAAAGLYGLHWLLCGAALFFIVQTSMEPSAAISIPNVFSAAQFYALAWLAGFLVLIAPAGVGFREAVLTALLVALGGLSVSNAAASALLLRLLFVIAELIWSGAGMAVRKTPAE
jgi:hypothetical protein